MSSSTVDATPINLKERIAALQQLSNASSPPPSPSFSTNNDASLTRQPPTAGANANIKLREKIARFEKKGGVPVPRGSFGLGAPPLQDGHTKRQGELYGNRIQHPVRVASSPQGVPSSSGHAHPPSSTVRPRGNARRSYSLSNANILMTSEFAGGVDTGGVDTLLTSPSAEETVQQGPVLSAESPVRLNLQDEHGQSPVGSALPDIVISQGEDDSVTEATGLPLEKEAQVAVKVDAEVPETAEDVATPSVHSPDLDTKPISPSSTDIIDSPSFSSSPLSVLPSSPHVDAASAVSPILSPATSTHGSPQSVSEGPTSFARTTKEVYQKENIRAETKAKVEEGEADVKGKTAPPALDLDTGITMPQSGANGAIPSSQPRNTCKEAAKAAQEDKPSAAIAESDIPSSPTTPHATQSPLPETSYSASTKLSSSLEPLSHFGASIRPASMIELTSSPNHTQPAQREEAEIGRGSVTILDQQSDFSRQNPSSYRAAVHNERRDDLAKSRSLAPQVGRTSSALSGNGPSAFNVPGTTTTIPGLPVISSSAGFGDLSDLLQNTFLLEQTLESGDLPTEPGIPVIVADDDGDISRETVTTRPDGVEVRRLSRGEAEENKKTLAKLQAKREEQAKSKLRSSFRNTLTRAVGGGNGGAISGADVTASFDAGESVTAVSQQEQPQYYSKRFKSPSVPQLLDSTTHNGSTRSKTPEIQFGRAHKPASLTSSKSAKSRFPNFRRLTSSSKSSEGHGGRLDRSSFSTCSEISSEDSTFAIVTPPDMATEFGEGVKGREGSWNPEMSRQGSPQKKGKDNMSRAATFAGKIWSRARMRSGASTLSTQSSLGRTSSEAPPSLPPLPNIILPEESENAPALVNPPTRSTSLSPRSPKFSSSQLPSSSPDLSLSLSFDTTEETRSSTPVQSFKHTNSLLPESPPHGYASSRRRSEIPPTSPTSPPSIRPLSWMSESQSGSHLNSPLSMLDSDFFDAFPSVPENKPLVLTPPNPSPSYSHSQQQAAPMASKATQPSPDGNAGPRSGVKQSF